MHLSNSSSSCQRYLLASLFVTVLAVTPYWVTDPMNLPKMAVLGILSFLLLGSCLPKIDRNFFHSNRFLTALICLFVFLLIINLFFSGRVITENLYGISGRNTGVLTYLSLLFSLISAALISSEEFLLKFRYIFFALGFVLIVYGTLQYFGLEPFPYVSVYENLVFGTFGNPNFQSAFMGIFGSYSFVIAFDSKFRWKTRVMVSMISLASVFGIYSTNSWQGFFNFAAGLGVGFTLLLYRKERKVLAGFVLSFGLITSVLVAFGILNKGPLAQILSKGSLEARRLYWETAFRLLVDHPLVGVGMDGFGDWYRRGRSVAAFESNPGLLTTSAHSVPLDIAAGGGFPLLLVYLGFILLAIISIFRVIKNSNNLSIGFIAITSAWVSYQAQSLISINQIGLGIIGWILTGLIIGYSRLTTEKIEDNKSEKSTKVYISQNQDTSFSAFISPIVALILGATLALPPYIAANKFYNATRSTDVKTLIGAAYMSPREPQRMLIAAQILEKNKFYKESLEMTLAATKNFPDCYEGWNLLLSLTNSSDPDKARAKEELLRLDPNLPK